MRLNGTEVVDTFAEAFPMWGARVLITAATPAWALEAARSMTGFATSVIGCKCEAGIERELAPDETPDGRPGVSALLFAMDKEGVGKRLVERVGQCVLTSPTAACFNGIEATLEKLFEDHYSVQFASYPVREPWLLEPARTVASEPR